MADIILPKRFTNERRNKVKELDAIQEALSNKTESELEKLNDCLLYTSPSPRDRG